MSVGMAISKRSMMQM